MNEQRVRAFIAIKLPEVAKQAIGTQQTRLAENTMSRAARWTPPGNIHLTLKFLGDVPCARLGVIEQTLRRITHAHRTFKLSISGIGCFPSTRRPRIIWIGVGGDIERLLTLQEDVESGLCQLGWARERRPFRPHLTIARVRNSATPTDRSRLGTLVEDTHVGDIADVDVVSVDLIKSDLRPDGPIYTDLARAALPPRNKPSMPDKDKSAT